MRVVRNSVLKLISVAVFFAVGAPAAIIFDSGLTSITAANPTQLGRLSRSGVISDWSTTKAFPGVLNATTVYSYVTFDVVVPYYYPYIQVTIDSVQANTFASAYAGAYLPNPTAANRGLDVDYLGDAGTSGNLVGGTDPIGFQVILPASKDLIVVVNTTAAAGLGQNFDILVEGFTDNQFDDTPPTTPEPATMATAATCLIGIAAFRKRLFKSGR